MAVSSRAVFNCLAGYTKALSLAVADCSYNTLTSRLLSEANAHELVPRDRDINENLLIYGSEGFYCLRGIVIYFGEKLFLIIMNFNSLRYFDLRYAFVKDLLSF